MEFSIFALFKYNLMKVRFLFKNLTRFPHEHLVLILGLKITSWLVMSSVRKSKPPPLSYVLKCSQLIGVNEGNANIKSLITFKACEPCRYCLTCLCRISLTSCIILHRF
jgi:hypothetical protein